MPLFHHIRSTFYNWYNKLFPLETIFIPKKKKVDRLLLNKVTLESMLK